LIQYAISLFLAGQCQFCHRQYIVFYYRKVICNLINMQAQTLV
jgi:hypothetical protein